MPMRRVFLILSVLLSGCASVPMSPADPALAKAEALIDAFYSFEGTRLRPHLADAPKSAPQILYYQGWAEGGHYGVLDRQACRREKTSVVACSIKVKDDLIQALQTGYDVTDTFHLTFADGRIVKVDTSSDDPKDMSDAFKWLRARSPDLWTTGPCKGFFAGGTTPQDCIRSVAAGFSDYRAAHPRAGR